MIDIDQALEVRQYLAEYAKNPFGFVLLSGKNGTGKSFAAKAVYHCVTPHRLPHKDHDIAIFITQAELNIRWASSLDQISYLLKEFYSTKFLVLDDIGTRTPSEAFMDFLYAVVDHRYNNRHVLGTMITTNLNAVSMREKFGDAFVSRVASGKCYRWEHEDRRFDGYKTHRNLSSTRYLLLDDPTQQPCIKIAL